MWACTRPFQSVHAAAELVCRGRVIVLVSYVMSTAAVGRVILDYQDPVLYNIEYKSQSYQVPGNYVIDQI